MPDFMFSLMPVSKLNLIIQLNQATKNKFSQCLRAENIFHLSHQTRIHISIVENRGVPMRFEIDIMKKFPTINLKFTFLPLSNMLNTSFLVQSAVALSNFQCKQKQTKYYQNICEKVKFDKDWVRLFNDINLKNNGATVIPQFSTICG